MDRTLDMIDGVGLGYRPMFPVRLGFLLEFAHAAPAYATVKELRDRLAVPLPNEQTIRRLL
jgi:hypothetical protein